MSFVKLQGQLNTSRQAYTYATIAAWLHLASLVMQYTFGDRNKRRGGVFLG